MELADRQSPRPPGRHHSFLQIVFRLRLSALNQILPWILAFGRGWGWGGGWSLFPGSFHSTCQLNTFFGLELEPELCAGEENGEDSESAPRKHTVGGKYLPSACILFSPLPGASQNNHYMEAAQMPFSFYFLRLAGGGTCRCSWLRLDPSGWVCSPHLGQVTQGPLTEPSSPHPQAGSRLLHLYAQISHFR